MNSHLLPLFISYRKSGEKLIKNQANSSCVIMSRNSHHSVLQSIYITRRNLMLITPGALRVKKLIKWWIAGVSYNASSTYTVWALEKIQVSFIILFSIFSCFSDIYETNKLIMMIGHGSCYTQYIHTYINFIYPRILV